MLDQYGRTIDYMRISITDRCNLRCRYCMPDGIACEEHDAILRYEEILRICLAATKLGITKFKITGGEPLVRKDCVSLIRTLKSYPGVRQVTITTNGILLAQNLDALCGSGLDGLNISLDTLDRDRFREIAGYAGFRPDRAKALLRECCSRGLHTKLNTVLLQENRQDAVTLASLAAELPLDVRFIELMPIGYGGTMSGADPDEILSLLQSVWPDLRPTDKVRGNGPAHYYESASLLGCIGFIDAVSHRFCDRCNRVRLTSTGQLKPCLCFDSTLDLRAMLRSGCSEEELLEALRRGIESKPRSHRFDLRQEITEHRTMSQIGG